MDKKCVCVLLQILFCLSAANADNGSLIITAKPALECRVALDNIDIGITPLTQNNVSPGAHYLVVVYEDKIVYGGEIIVNNGKQTKIDLDLSVNAPKAEDVRSLYHSDETKDTPALNSSDVVVSAEPYLKSYVDKQKVVSDNMTNACIGLGALSILYGNTLPVDPKRPNGSISNGVLFVYMGIMSKFFKPGFEEDYDKVIAIDNSSPSGKSERENLAIKTLDKCSKNASAMRSRSLLFGVLLGGFYLLQAPVIGLPLVYYAWDMNNNKSKAEIAQESYLRAVKRGG